MRENSHFNFNRKIIAAIFFSTAMLFCCGLASLLTLFESQDDKECLQRKLRHVVLSYHPTNQNIKTGNCNEVGDVRLLQSNIFTLDL